MKPYQSYKDVGEVWIRKIPSHWKVTKLKFLSSENVTYGINISSDNYQENGIRFIRTTDIDEFGNLIDNGVYLKKEDVDDIYLLIDGDFLISRSGTVGRAYVHKENFGEACFAGYLVRFRFYDSQVAKYIFWFTKTKQFQLWLDFQRIESTISNVNGQKYANLSIGMPISKNEIDQIINFINSKTAKIDTLIAKKQRLIELLQEYRTALINQAVTKGLDPKVPMKDSGYEWLGKIPEHWELSPIKYVCTINRSALNTSTPENYEIQYIDISSVDDTGKISPPQIYRFSEAPSRARRVIRKNDIIISTVRTYLKAVAFIESEDNNLIASTGFATLTAKSSINPKFLYRVVSNHAFVENVTANSVGVSYPAINSSEFANLLVCLPPTQKEQEDIQEFIEANVEKINKTIAIYERQIFAFQELKKALISDAVTGKIDVRDWKGKNDGVSTDHS